MTARGGEKYPFSESSGELSLPFLALTLPLPSRGALIVAGVTILVIGTLGLVTWALLRRRLPRPGGDAKDLRRRSAQPLVAPPVAATLPWHHQDARTRGSTRGGAGTAGRRPAAAGVSKQASPCAPLRASRYLGVLERWEVARARTGYDTGVHVALQFRVALRHGGAGRRLNVPARVEAAVAASLMRVADAVPMLRARVVRTVAAAGEGSPSGSDSPVGWGGDLAFVVAPPGSEGASVMLRTLRADSGSHRRARRGRQREAHPSVLVATDDHTWARTSPAAGDSSERDAATLSELMLGEAATPFDDTHGDVPLWRATLLTLPADKVGGRSAESSAMEVRVVLALSFHRAITDLDGAWSVAKAVSHQLQDGGSVPELADHVSEGQVEEKRAPADEAARSSAPQSLPVLPPSLEELVDTRPTLAHRLYSEREQHRLPEVGEQLSPEVAEAAAHVAASSKDYNKRPDDEWMGPAHEPGAAALEKRVPVLARVAIDKRRTEALRAACAAHGVPLESAVSVALAFACWQVRAWQQLPIAAVTQQRAAARATGVRVQPLSDEQLPGGEGASGAGDTADPTADPSHKTNAGSRKALDKLSVSLVVQNLVRTFRGLLPAKDALKGSGVAGNVACGNYSAPRAQSLSLRGRSQFWVEARNHDKAHRGSVDAAAMDVGMLAFILGDWTDEVRRAALRPPNGRTATIALATVFDSDLSRRRGGERGATGDQEWSGEGGWVYAARPKSGALVDATAVLSFGRLHLSLTSAASLVPEGMLWGIAQAAVEALLLAADATATGGHALVTPRGVLRAGGVPRDGEHNTPVADDGDGNSDSAGS